MKKLSFILLAITTILIISCTKQKPDWDQVSCEHASIFQQSFTDTISGITIGDPVLIFPQGDGDGLLCDDRLANTKRMLRDNKWEQLCDVDGAKYWVYTYATFKP
jgi:hypothetical protein